MLFTHDHAKELALFWEFIKASPAPDKQGVFANQRYFGLGSIHQRIENRKGPAVGICCSRTGRTSLLDGLGLGLGMPETAKALNRKCVEFCARPPDTEVRQQSHFFETSMSISPAFLLHCAVKFLLYLVSFIFHDEKPLQP